MTSNTLRHGYGTDMPIWAWCYFPIALLVVQFLAAELLEYETYYKIIDTELGLIENLTVLFAVFAIITGCRIWFTRSNFPSMAYHVYIILLISGCIYILGEETSWGQHYMQWETPDWLGDINQQDETNLHNVHNIFGVVPKIGLEWSIYICGIFLALKFRKNNTVFDPKTNWQYWILPTFIIFPSALFAFILRIIDRFENWFDWDYTVDWDETHECLLLYVILLYMLSIHKRLKQG